MRPQLPEGYTVKYRHRRMTARGDMYSLGSYERGLGEFLSVSPKGGETEAKVYGPDDAVVAIGVATCHERDNFNRRIGRDIALGRALKRLEQKQLMAQAGNLRQGSTWDTHDGNPPPRVS